MGDSGGRQRSGGEELGLPSSRQPPQALPYPTPPHPNSTQISQLLARALTFFNLLDLATLGVMGSLKILNVDCLNISHPPPFPPGIVGPKRTVQFHAGLVLQNLKLAVVGALLGMSEVEKTFQFSFLIFARPSLVIASRSTGMMGGREGGFTVQTGRS